jgi:hypothetical protein
VPTLHLGVGRSVSCPLLIFLDNYDAISHHYWVIDGRLEMTASPHRYVWVL